MFLFLDGLRSCFAVLWPRYFNSFRLQHALDVGEDFDEGCVLLDRE
jgi:hypothetical protein